MKILKRSYKLRVKEGEDNSLTGYAFRFNETADGWYGKERFSPELEVELDPECFLLRDHSTERLLGRVGKNMEVKTDSEGLFFKVSPLPDTALAKETKTLIKDGLLSGASVAFSVVTDRTEDKVTVFEKIKLYEISLVPRPYYKSSEIEARQNPTLKNRILPPELYL